MADDRALPGASAYAYADEHRLVLTFAFFYFVCCGLIAAGTGTWLLWLAVGMPALVFPAWLTRTYPASLLARLAISAGCMTFVLLGVQQTFGFSEAHFSFFVMITILAVYRDWKVLIFGAVLVIAHHLLFTIFEPEAIGFYIPGDPFGAWRHVLWHLGVGLIQVFTLCYLTIMLRRREALNAALGHSLDREKERADRDPLTGLSNRHHLGEVLDLLWSDGAHRSAALCVIDIDHFKMVNDRYGHAAGDDVLRAVANTIRSQIGRNDFAFRLGGEEFLIMIPSVSGTDAVDLAEHVRRQVASALITTSKMALTVTVSIGVATARANETFDEMFKRADEVLYRAKSLGRNRVELWSSAPAGPEQRLSA